MKRLAIAAIAIFLAVSVPTEVSGQTHVMVGPQVGLDVGDIEEPFFGASVRIGLPTTRITINPAFDYYLTDDPLTFWALSANALYRFGIDNQAFTPYSGAGLGIYRSSVDGIGGSSDFGLNAIFGAEFSLGSVRPFLEAQYSPVFTEGNTTSLFSVKGGLLFGF